MSPEDRIRLLSQSYDFAGDARQAFQEGLQPRQDEVLRMRRPQSAPLLGQDQRSRLRRQMDHARQQIQDREDFMQEVFRESMEEPEMPAEPANDEEAMEAARFRTQYEGPWDPQTQQPVPGERYHAPYHREMPPFVPGRVMPSDIRRKRLLRGLDEGAEAERPAPFEEP